METCERFRQLLSRFAEGEAEPGEALRLARHLAGCTACKIVLARERRLHEALDGLGDPVSVDDEFSRLVMAALPAGPPPAARRSRRRGLRLAGFLLAGSVGGAIAFRLLSLSPASEPLRIASRLDLESGSRWLGAIGKLAGAAAAAMARVATGLPAGPSSSTGGIGLAGPALLAGAAVLAAGAFLAVTAWAVATRPDAGPTGASSDEKGPGGGRN